MSPFDRVVQRVVIRKSVTMTSVGSGGTSFTAANVGPGSWTVVGCSAARASGANSTAIGLAFGADLGATPGQPQHGVYVQTWNSSGRLTWSNEIGGVIVPSSGTFTGWLIGNGATGDVIEVEIVMELRESGEATVVAPTERT